MRIDPKIYKNYNILIRSDSPALHNQRMRMNDGSPGGHPIIQSPAEREAIYSCSSIHENRYDSGIHISYSR